MADFDKINIDSASYNVKDTQAREQLETLDKTVQAQATAIGEQGRSISSLNAGLNAANENIQELDNKLDTAIETQLRDVIGDISSRRLCRIFKNSNYSSNEDTGWQPQGFTQDNNSYYIGFSGSTSTSVIQKISKTTLQVLGTVTVANSHVNNLDIYQNTLYCASALNTSEIITLSATDLSVLSRKYVDGVSTLAAVTVDNGTIYAGGVEVIYTLADGGSNYTIQSQFNTGVNFERTTQTILVRNGTYYGLMFNPNCIVSGTVGNTYSKLINIPAWIEALYPLGEPEDIDLNSSGNIVLASWTLLCPRSEVAMTSISELGTSIGVPMTPLLNAQIPAVPQISVSENNNINADGFNTPFRYVSEALLSCKSPIYRQAAGFTINVSSGTYDSVALYGINNTEILCTAPCELGQFTANVCSNVTISGARFTVKTNWASYSQLYRLHRCSDMTLSQARFVNQNSNINYISIVNSNLHITSILSDGDNDISSPVASGTFINIAASNLDIDFDLPLPYNVQADSTVCRGVVLSNTVTNISNSGTIAGVTTNASTLQQIASRAKCIKITLGVYGDEHVVFSNFDKSNNNIAFAAQNIGNSDPWTVQNFEVCLDITGNTISFLRANSGGSGPITSTDQFTIKRIDAMF